MNYHIVRTNDNVEMIMNMYNLTMSELIDLNKHITNWKSLIPGTRIKLPIISEAISEELNDVEPFIEDYYPKIDLSRYESKDKVELEKEDVILNDVENSIYNKEEEITKEIEDSQNSKNSNFTNTIKLPYNYNYNNYYYNPYNYYRNRQRKKK